jgi:hypothetical protein
LNLDPAQHPSWPEWERKLLRSNRVVYSNENMGERKKERVVAVVLVARPREETRPSEKQKVLQE